MHRWIWITNDAFFRAYPEVFLFYAMKVEIQRPQIPKAFEIVSETDTLRTKDKRSFSFARQFSVAVESFLQNAWGNHSHSANR